MLVQRIQYGWGISVFISAVKSQINDFFLRIIDETGMILLQFLIVGISNGLRPFLLKTKAPVSLGGRRGRTGGFGRRDAGSADSNGKGKGEQEQIKYGTFPL